MILHVNSNLRNIFPCKPMTSNLFNVMIVSCVLYNYVNTPSIQWFKDT